MRPIKLSSRCDFAPLGIPRKQHNRQYVHRYVTAQQRSYRGARDFWQTQGIPSISKWVTRSVNKKTREDTLE